MTEQRKAGTILSGYANDDVGSGTFAIRPPRVAAPGLNTSTTTALARRPGELVLRRTFGRHRSTITCSTREITRRKLPAFNNSNTAKMDMPRLHDGVPCLSGTYRDDSRTRLEVHKDAVADAGRSVTASGTLLAARNRGLGSLNGVAASRYTNCSTPKNLTTIMKWKSQKAEGSVQY